MDRVLIVVENEANLSAGGSRDQTEYPFVVKMILQCYFGVISYECFFVDSPVAA